jgi:hypothetical protein
MLITLNVSHVDVVRLVATSLHESMRDIARMYDYGEYPEEVANDLAALNKAYQYYTGKEMNYD